MSYKCYKKLLFVGYLVTCVDPDFDHSRYSLVVLADCSGGSSDLGHFKNY